MAFRFAGDMFRNSFNEEDDLRPLGLRQPSIGEREWETEDDETLRELEKNEQSIRSAISRLKAKRIRTKRF